LEGIKFDEKKTDWNPIRVRTKGRPKKRWRDEVINGLNKLKLRFLNQIFKVREACKYLVQTTKPHVGL
jgi:hypothetical protein